MPAVHRRQPLRGQAVQPRVKRQRAIARIVRQLPRGVGQRLLHDVRSVHAGRQPIIEPQGDHATQPLPVALEKPFNRCGVAGGGVSEQDDQYRPDRPGVMPRPSANPPECILSS